MSKINRFIKLIRRFFTPPVFPDDEEKTYQAHVLNSVLQALAINMMLAVFGVLFVFAQRQDSALAVAALGLMFVLVRWGLQRGKVRQASILLVIGMWIITTSIVALSGGMRSIDVSFYVSGTAVTGALLGTWAAGLYAGGSALAGLAMVLFESTVHPLPRVFLVPARSGWLILLFNLSIILSVVSPLLRDLRNALGRARRQLKERAETEQALRSSEERWRRLFENSPDACFLYDREGTIMDLNPAAENLAGRTRDELIGTCLLDLFPGEDRRKVAAQIRQAHDSGTVTSCSEYAFHRGRPTEMNVEFTCFPVRIQGEAMLFAIAHDTTQRTRSQEKEIHQQRQHAQRGVAQGICHNLNNLLTGVLLPAQYLQRFSEDPDVVEAAETIATAAQHAADVVEHLRRATEERADEDQHCPVNLVEVVQKAMDQLRPHWAGRNGVNFQVITRLHDVPSIQATREEAQDVVHQLLLNAGEALAERGQKGGKIVIETEMVNHQVCLRVRDTGIGMDEDTRRRIFEPFFTTKKDVGSGLGLSRVLTQITRWGGRVEVESTPGQGTTVTLLFPPGETRDDPSGEEEALRSRRRILVVEDERIVRDVIDAMLSTENRLDTFASGVEALARFEPGRYDVALIDLIMPDMNGDEVAEEIRRRDPSVKTVLMTGWNLSKEDPRLGAFDHCIQKPLSLEELESVIAGTAPLLGEGRTGGNRDA